MSNIKNYEMKAHDDIVDNLFEQLNYLNELPDFNESCTTLYIFEAIREIKSLRSQLSSQWVSVDDRLPDEWQKVLVYRKKNGISIGNWFEHDSGKQLWTIGGTTANRDSMEYPAYWMNLPTQPKD